MSLSVPTKLTVIRACFQRLEEAYSLNPMEGKQLAEFEQILNAIGMAGAELIRITQQEKEHDKAEGTKH